MWPEFGRDLQRAFWAALVACFGAGCLGGALVLLVVWWLSHT